MSPILTVLTVVFVVAVSMALGWLLRVAYGESRAEDRAWRRDQAEHTRLLAVVRRWQGGSAGDTPVLAWRVTGHRATLRSAFRRFGSAAVGLAGRLRPSTLTPPPAEPTPAEPTLGADRQSPPPPYNPPYRGSASLDVPFDVQLRVRNDWLHAAATGQPLPAAANLEDTGLIPRVVDSERDGAYAAH